MSDARRFAFVLPNYYPRTCGIGDFSARLAHELRGRGVEVVLFARLPVAPHPEAPDVPVSGAAGATPIAIAMSLFEAMRAARTTDVFLQYTSQMWDAWRFGSPALPWLAARARKAGMRVFLLAHEPYVVFSRRPDMFAASILQRLQLLAAIRSCNRVFVTTETRLSFVEPMCRVLGLPAPGVIRVGANALPRVRGAVLKGARTGVFSSAAVGKRFDVILQAFERIARARPDAALVLIGDLGPADSPRVREVRDAIKKHPAADRIRLTGKLELDAVAREIEALDVYLFIGDTGVNTRSSTVPSAFGSGVPVVATRGRETDASLFRDRENVLFADDLTGPALAAAALEVLGNSALASRLSEGGRRLYETDLSWPRIADHVLAEMRPA